MKFSRAASRYAKSLLDLAVERNELEVAFKDVNTIREAIEGSRDLELLVNSKVVQEEKKLPIYDKVFGGSISELTLKFIKLVAKNHRSEIIPAICSDFNTKYNEYKKILTVEVISAVKLSDEQKAKMVGILKTDNWNEVKLVETIDPSIIGGVIFKTHDLMVDTSISSQLNEMKQRFVNTSYVSQL